jgi:hypothetical protein
MMSGLSEKKKRERREQSNPSMGAFLHSNVYTLLYMKKGPFLYMSHILAGEHCLTLSGCRTLMYSTDLSLSGAL